MPTSEPSHLGLISLGGQPETLRDVINAGFCHGVPLGFPDPDDCVEYLTGLEVVSMDFRDVIGSVYGNRIIIADPPYLNSTISAYRGSGWSLDDFRDLMNLLEPPYILFSHDGSGVLDHIPSSAEVMPIGVRISHNKKYEDYMIVVK